MIKYDQEDNYEIIKNILKRYRMTNYSQEYLFIYFIECYTQWYTQLVIKREPLGMIIRTINDNHIHVDYQRYLNR